MEHTNVLHFLKTDPRAITPTRANEFDAGLDLYALEDVEVWPGEIKRYPTGIRVAMSSLEVGLYWDKSGRAWDTKADRPVGLSIVGGCIDGPYRGDLTVVVANLNIFNTLKMMQAMCGETNKFLLDQLISRAQQDVIRIPYGRALTQFIIVNYPRFANPVEVDRATWDKEFANTVRGERGFGSSDKGLTATQWDEARRNLEAGRSVNISGLTLQESGKMHVDFVGTVEPRHASIITTNVKLADGPLKGQTAEWPLGDRNEWQIDGHQYRLIPNTLPPEATYAEKPTSKMFACEIIDGPHRGDVIAIVPKDVLYYKGTKYRRTTPDGYGYREAVGAWAKP